MAKPEDFKKRAFFDWRYVKVEHRRAYRLALLLFWSILLTFFFQRFVVGFGIVTDRSMRPTLQEGSAYLINKYIYHFTRPRRGDVVVFSLDPHRSEQLVKRVVGLEGEKVAILRGEVFINGKSLSEPYAVGQSFPDLSPFLVKKGACFVMGDNRADSEDSRHFGVVPLKRIDGKIQPGELFPFR